MMKVANCLARSAFAARNTFAVARATNLRQQSLLKNSPRRNFSSEKPTENAQTSGRTVEAESENVGMENQKQKRNLFWTLWRITFWTSVGLFGYNYYLIENYPDPEKQPGSVKFFMDSAKGLRKQIRDLIDFFTKPPVKKLLPDVPPMMPGMEYPKTLVLNLSGTLVHTDFVLGKGAQIKMRPNLTDFLKIVANMYEVVIFTDDETFFVHSVLEKLDPTQQMFAGRFAREAMVYDRGEYYKDLRYLNRDLRRVVVIEKDQKLLRKQVDNGIYLPEYKGEADDKTLSELLPLLMHLTKPQIRDVREELKLYGNVNPGKKFLEQMQTQMQALQQQQSRGLYGLFNQS